MTPVLKQNSLGTAALFYSLVVTLIVRTVLSMEWVLRRRLLNDCMHAGNEWFGERAVMCTQQPARRCSWNSRSPPGEAPPSGRILKGHGYHKAILSVPRPPADLHTNYPLSPSLRKEIPHTPWASHVKHFSAPISLANWLLLDLSTAHAMSESIPLFHLQGKEQASSR